MRKSVLVTAMGDVIGIHPSMEDPEKLKWYVVYFNLNGNFQCCSLSDSRAAAVRERTKIFRLHRELKLKEKKKE